MEDVRPKIVYFATQLYPIAAGQTSGFGGAETELWNVAHAVARDPDFDVQALTFGPDAATTAPMASGDLTLHLIRPAPPLTYENSWLERRRAIISYFARLFRCAKNLKADIYCTKLASSEAATIWLAARATGARYVYRVEHDWETNPQDLVSIIFRGSKFWAKAFLFALRRADLVVVQTQAQAEALKANYGVDSVLIPNGHAIPPDDQISADPAERPVVLWVGRCHPMKRPELFLHLARQQPHVKFRMILPPNPEHPELFEQTQAEARQLDNMEFVPGAAPAQMAAHYQQARLLLLTSDAEGFSNVVIEALKYGAPVVTWDHNPNQLLATVTTAAEAPPAAGFCVDDDSDLGSELTARLWTDYNFWIDCHTIARQTAKDTFGIDRVVATYRSHFKGLLNTP